MLFVISQTVDRSIAVRAFKPLSSHHHGPVLLMAHQQYATNQQCQQSVTFANDIAATYLLLRGGHGCRWFVTTIVHCHSNCHDHHSHCQWPIITATNLLISVIVDHSQLLVLVAAFTIVCYILSGVFTIDLLWMVTAISPPLLAIHLSSIPSFLFRTMASFGKLIYHSTQEVLLVYTKNVRLQLLG